MAKTSSNSSPLPAYKKLAKTTIRGLSLRTPIKIKLDEACHFGLEPSAFVIYAAKKRNKREDAVLVHYLTHAKLIEEGLPLLEVQYELDTAGFMKVSGMSKEEYLEKCVKNFHETFWGIANRGADQFLDFFVWQIVTQRFGKKWFRNYIDWFLKDGTPRRLIELFERQNSLTKIPYHSYLGAIEYFADFYVLCRVLGFSSEARLIERRYRAVKRNREYRAAMFPFTDQRIKELRALFLRLHKQYPDPITLAHRPKQAERIYASYLKRYWSGTSFKPETIHARKIA